MISEDNTSHTLKHRFKRFILENALFKPEDRILLAVSGGVDSMIMAHLFLSSGYTFAIAHCNFSLRGLESDNDEIFVKQWCLEHKIPFYSQRFNTLARVEGQKISIQMAARELRYGWFESLCKEKGYSYCSLAHHKNDVLETILINLIRGTGIAGLRGILPKSGIYIRPLLDFTKSEILEESENLKIPFREDSSNQFDKYIRNRLRHQVIPILREINPNLENTLNSHTLSLRFSEYLAEEKKKELVASLWVKASGNPAISISRILEWGFWGPELLFTLLEPYSFTHSVCHEIYNHLQGRSGAFFYSNTHRLGTDREFLFLEPLDHFSKTDLKTYIQVRDSQDSSLESNFTRFYIQDILEVERIKDYLLKPDSFDNKKNIPFMPDAFHAYFDMETLGIDIQYRYWQEGDAFFPLGMKHSKKLSDFFIDLKVPMIEKSKIPLVLSQDKIIWIAGYRTDDRFKIRSTTRSILCMEYKKF